MAARPSAVKRFKDSHHMLARMFASGMRPGEVARASGYSNSRVSILCADPAFQELIAGYRSVVDETWVKGTDAFMSLATANMLKAERMLADRLDEAEDEGVYPTVRELVMVSADRADRFGYAKRAMQVNLNLDFAARLDRAVARSGVVIEGQVNPSAVEREGVGPRRLQSPSHSVAGAEIAPKPKLAALQGADTSNEARFDSVRAARPELVVANSAPTPCQQASPAEPSPPAGVSIRRRF